MKTFVITTLFALTMLGAGCASRELKTSPTPSVPQSQSRSPSILAASATATQQEATMVSSASTSSTFALPLEGALARVTKKPFGLYVTPQNSPVQPERFRGYHVGTDFETTPEEKDAAVTVHAICDGPLALKKWATGYGGVAVQRCTIDHADVTVIYGHLKLASSTTAVGTVMHAGEAFAILGKGYSTETDGERKHLHLGIHKGKTISILGYVQSKASLSAWIDPMSVLK
jgi:hypothetical protein